MCPVVELQMAWPSAHDFECMRPEGCTANRVAVFVLGGGCYRLIQASLPRSLNFEAVVDSNLRGNSSVLLPCMSILLQHGQAFVFTCSARIVTTTAILIYHRTPFHTFTISEGQRATCAPV